MEALKAFMGMMTFVAALSTFIAFVISGFIVSIIGLLIGAGLFALGAAKSLGLIS